MDEIFALILEQHKDLILRVILLLIGYFVAMCINYIKLGQELSYIKGQLLNILSLQNKIAVLFKKSASLEQEMIKTVKDLDHVMMRIEILEKT